MKTILQKKVFAAISFVMLILGVCAHIEASTGKDEICLPCSESAKAAPWVRYPPLPIKVDSKTHYVLTTKGLKVPHRDDHAKRTEIITDWEDYTIEIDEGVVPLDSTPVVIASCGFPQKDFSKGHFSNVKDMVSQEDDITTDILPLVCGKGQPFYVSVLGPTCKRKEVSYVGDVTIITDDEDDKPITSSDTTVEYSIGGYKVKVIPPNFVGGKSSVMMGGGFGSVGSGTK